MRPCLIQVEFFHVNLNGSLDDIWYEPMSRTVETLPDAMNGLSDLGPGIKTALRFHDTKSGTITKLALNIEGLGKQIEAAVSISIDSQTGWLRKKLYRWKLRRLRVALKVHKGLLDMALARHVSQAVLAVERVDRRYRLLRDDEKHELLAKIKKSSRFWLFIFTPNDLLSERNKTVTAIM